MRPHTDSHRRSSGGKPSRRCAILLACIGVALAFAVAVSSAVGPASSFSPPAIYSTGRDTLPNSIAIGDLNGDGSPDLVTADLRGGVSVLLNSGDGSFHARRPYRTGPNPIAVRTGDLNGDGKLDLVTISPDVSRISTLLNRGDGSFAAPRSYRTDRKPRSVAIGDLTGDGKPELVTANAYLADPSQRNPGTVSLFLNKGDGTFRERVNYRPGKLPRSVALRDLNGDGKLDLATANADANTVSVFINRGDGSFGQRRDYRTGRTPHGLAIGDLNRDGKPDLVTASSRTVRVSVLLNRGDGSFAAPRSYGAGYPRRDVPGIVVIGDLNGDRTPDLATVGDFCSFAFSVLDNRGDGSFERFVDHRTSCAQSVAIGDLNGDGRSDLATTNGSDRFDRGLVSVFINRPGRCTVQPVIEMGRAAATRAIVHANCKVGTISLRYSQLVRKGHVIAQRPGFGAVLPKGGKVELVVSRGRKQ